MHNYKGYRVSNTLDFIVTLQHLPALGLEDIGIFLIYEHPKE